MVSNKYDFGELRWTIEQAVVWIERRNLHEVAKTVHLEKKQATCDELRTELLKGKISAFGCVDGDLSEKLNPEVWRTHRIELHHVAMMGLIRAGTNGNTFVRARSFQKFPAAALKDLSYRADGPPIGFTSDVAGYYRVISHISLSRTELVDSWPATNMALGKKSLNGNSSGAKRKREGTLEQLMMAHLIKVGCASEAVRKATGLTYQEAGRRAAKSAKNAGAFSLDSKSHEALAKLAARCLKRTDIS